MIEIYEELQKQGVSLYMWDFPEKAAVIEVDNQYAIFMDHDMIDSIAEETVVIAHECGHIATGSTHKVSSPYDLIEKHEYKANAWAIKKLLPFPKMKEAMKLGFVEPYELAEYFCLPENFIKKAFNYYAMRCGKNFDDNRDGGGYLGKDLSEMPINMS
jgi:Zn-dependent peptidase ImmA (M78 family)